MSHMNSGVKNLFDGLRIFFQELAVVLILAISYVILFVKKVVKTIMT